MRQAVSAATKAGCGASPLASSTRAHNFAQGAVLGDGDEQVGAGGDPEPDQLARVIERDAGGGKRAQILHGIGDDEGELLRLGAAGGVHGASVGNREGALEAARGQIGHALGEDSGKLVPRQRCRAARRHGAERIEAETDVRRGWIGAARLHQRGQRVRRFQVLPAHVQFERDAGVEMHAFERGGDRLRRTVEAVAIGAGAAGEGEAQAGGAVFQIVQRLAVGGLGVGMVYPLHHLPGRSRPPGHHRRMRRPLVKRLDPQAVIGAAHQPLVEIGAFQRRLDQRAPLRVADGREFGGEGEVFGHGP